MMVPYQQPYGRPASFGAGAAYPQQYPQAGAVAQYARPAAHTVLSVPHMHSGRTEYGMPAVSHHAHHHQQYFGPISPYPELKDLEGPLHNARHHTPNHHHAQQHHAAQHASKAHQHASTAHGSGHGGLLASLGNMLGFGHHDAATKHHAKQGGHHAQHPGQHSAQHPGQHHAQHPGQHPGQFHGYPAAGPHFAMVPMSYEDFDRQSAGLPSFSNQWIEDPQEHHRPTYEQMLYAQYEQAHAQQMHRAHEARLHEGGQVSDMQAMSNARAGPNSWMYDGGAAGAPHQLAAPIKALVDAKRHEADRVRHIANQYLETRGHEDPATEEAEEVAVQAEAESHGAAAVERALETAAEGQATQQINVTVDAFDEEKKRAELAWHECSGRFGEDHQDTIHARMVLLQSSASWQGAMQARAAPAERGFEAAEHPQAIANRADAASHAYRAEAEELKRKSELAARKFGKKDVRTVEAEKAWHDADAKSISAMHEAEVAQAVADGKPAPKKKAVKKVKKKEGWC